MIDTGAYLSHSLYTTRVLHQIIPTATWYVFITWLCFLSICMRPISGELHWFFSISLFQSFVFLQFPQKENQMNWNHSLLMLVNTTITLQQLEPREHMNKSAMRRKGREGTVREEWNHWNFSPPPGVSPYPWNVIGLTHAVFVDSPAFTRMLCQTGSTKTRQRRKSMHAPSA